MSLSDFYAQIHRSVSATLGVMPLIVIALLIAAAGFTLCAGVAGSFGLSRMRRYSAGLIAGFVLAGGFAGWSLPGVTQQRAASYALIAQECTAYIAAAQGNHITVPPPPMLGLAGVLASDITTICHAHGGVAMSDLHEAMRAEIDHGVIAAPGADEAAMWHRPDMGS
ncbi:hypothetical protein [Acidiphilium sp.]|uniref:hypothetical protein n=1 Tax=Acidiphilium sp. TaxID=527 RepID=UPI003D04224E